MTLLDGQAERVKTALRKQHKEYMEQQKRIDRAKCHCDVHDIIYQTDDEALDAYIASDRYRCSIT